MVAEEGYEAQRAQELSVTLSSVSPLLPNTPGSASAAMNSPSRLSQEIAERVKELRIPRYRLVVTVTVGQVKGQGVHASSRCLWDATNDTCTSYTFRKGSLFGLASVFAVYLE